VRRNRVEERVDVRLADATAVLGEPADLILANLHLDLLMEILGRPELQRCPWIILAGAVGRQVDRLRERLRGLPFCLWDEASDGAWSAMLLGIHSDANRRSHHGNGGDSFRNDQLG
jgi:hypothetical protein